MTGLGLIGRDRVLMDKLAKRLHDAARRYYNFAPIQETRRGACFDVEILVDNEPTGHIARVTVELVEVKP